jgi:hypothetical protein
MKDNEYEMERWFRRAGFSVNDNGDGPFDQLGAASGIDHLEKLASLYAPVSWAEAWLAQPEAVEWLFEPVLEKGTVNAMFAKPGTGKSLIALEMALSLVRDGHTVVYVDDENRIVDLVERLQAFGAGPGELDQLLLYSFAGLPPLDTPRGGEHLLALATVGQASLVVLDTTTRMVQGKENDADTFLQLYRCSLVPLKGRGITALRLDHPGKDETRGQRGSSAKDGDVDTVWHLSTVVEGLQYLLRRAKSRSGHSPVEDIELRRRYEPLRHEWAAREGTPVDKIIGQLDDLAVPPSAGRPTAREALRKAGIKVENSLLEAAIYKRKNCPGQSAGNRAASDEADRCPPVPLIGTGSGQSPARVSTGDGENEPR